MFVAIRGLPDRRAQNTSIRQWKRGGRRGVRNAALRRHPHVQVADSRRALAQMSNHYFGHPAESMTMVGVTGTNGKTTTTFLIRSVLEQVTGKKWA